MQMKKSLLVAGAVTTLGLATMGGVSALAMGGGWHNGDENGLITRIAQRFNLNQADVEAVFDEHEKTEREAKISAYLQKLVDKGKLSAEQKTLIENKLKELAASKDQEKADVEVWAKAQGVEVEIVMKASHKDNSSRWLQELVDDGEITTEQKTAIEAKATELRTKHESERNALRQWAKDNKIDLKYLRMEGQWGKGHHGRN